MTHLQIRQLVEKKMGKPVPEWVWEWLEEEDYITSAIQEEEGERGAGVKWLIGKIKSLTEKSRSSKPVIPQIEEKTKEKEVSPDRRFWALSRIVASLANRDEEVQRFRREVLGGRLLSPEEVPEWIEEQANREQHTLTGGFWPHKESITLLEYISPPSQWVYGVAINKKGVLGRLKRIAAKFKGFWDEAKAVHFILTGQAFPVSQAKIRTTISAVPKITLEVSPHLRPEEVAKIYSKAKREYEQRFAQRRKLSEKHLTLAVFGVEEEGSWGQLLIKWNRKYPYWRYKDRATFARDVRTAYERVTGWEWKTVPIFQKMDKVSFQRLLQELQGQ